MQITDVSTTENNSFLQYHKYPSLEGTERKDWKEGVNRITAHTDESLMTLLFNSPGTHILQAWPLGLYVLACTWRHNLHAFFYFRQMSVLPIILFLLVDALHFCLDIFV